MSVENANMEFETSSFPGNLSSMQKGAVRGVIRPEELYTLAEIKSRLEFSDATLRSARRSGLRVYYVHGRAFILGADWIRYVVASVTGSTRK